MAAEQPSALERAIRRPERTVLFTAALLLLLAFLWFARRVLLLAFSGMLIALIFTGLVNQLRRLIRIKQGLGVTIVLIVLLGLGALLGYLLAPGLASEFSDLAQQLPRSTHRVLENLEQSTVYQRISSALPNLSKAGPGSATLLSHVTSAFGFTFEMVTGLVLLIFVALFLAASPDVYQNLVVSLIPPKHRPDAKQILARVICTLKFWLLGQFISMCLVGLMVGVAFGLCGLPLAASLGVLAGIGEFVPFIGPFAAAIPAMLLALNQSGKLFVIVLCVYLAIQFIEGHLIMPLVQRHTIDLPPVLTLLAVFFMGAAFGLLGMFVAAPLTAIALVLTEEIYLKRALGDSRRLLERG